MKWKKKNEAKCADWMPWMCCRCLWARKKPDNRRKKWKIVRKVKRSLQKRRRKVVREKKTKIRQCRKKVAHDGVILWKAKRTWLMVRMITTVGSCSKFQTRARSLRWWRTEQIRIFLCPPKRGLRIAEVVLHAIPVLGMTSNRLQTNHHRSSAFVVCINFNINSIWFCLPSFFSLVAVAFENWTERKQILRDESDAKHEGLRSRRASRTNVFSNHYKCNDPPMFVQKEGQKKATRLAQAHTECNHRQTNEWAMLAMPFGIIIFHQIPSRVPNFNSIYLLGNVCECY